MPDLTTLTWESLTGTGVLVVLLLAVIELAKRGKLIAGTREIYLFGLGCGQVLAQVAFWRSSEQWSAKIATDAALVGFLAAVLALGGHTMAQRLIEQRNGRTNGNGAVARPPP